MNRATFTLDDETETILEHLAAERQTSKSAIVREAVLEFGVRGDRLSEAERRRRIEGLARFLATPPSVPDSSALAEVASIRAARRESGRQRP